MSNYIHKSHNVTALIYHIVCPAKYRKAVFTKEIAKTLKEACLEIEQCYEIEFLEIGVDKDQVHFLVQSVPTYSPTKIVTTIKSITGKELFQRHADLKQQLYGGKFWTAGYYVNTVGRNNCESAITEYIKKQDIEQEYQQLYMNFV